jgi:hypothetical protein
VEADLVADLPEGIRELLAAPPLDEKALLELAVTWPGLPPEQAEMASALRLFVITWDPLEHSGPRPRGIATTNGGVGDLEIVVYAGVWSLAELATERESTIRIVLGAMAGSAVVTAAAHGDVVRAGRYPQLAVEAAVPGLLEDLRAGEALGAVEVRLAASGWGPIGLGAITDIVQHAYGPVDLDRSAVELSAAGGPRLGCPACAGRRFGFLADLDESKTSMCPDHRAEAERVTRTRLARANASNPDGWAAITDASARLSRPHLPGGLASKLPRPEEGIQALTEPGELAPRARAVVEAAGWFPARPEDFAVALGAEPDVAGFPDWLVNLVLGLGRAGLGDWAARVGDALARLDPDQESYFAGDVCVALAEAGHAEQARARVAAKLTRWPDDFWIRIHAGDALAALGDLDGAAEHFQTARDMAEQADNLQDRYDALARLRHIGYTEPEPPREQHRGQHHQPKRKKSKSQRKHR